MTLNLALQWVLQKNLYLFCVSFNIVSYALNVKKIIFYNKVSFVNIS